MAEGRIKRLLGTYGFIKPPKGKKDIFFHRSVLEGVRFEDLREGETVEYEFEQADKGPQATVVRAVGKERGDFLDFLNPYNFVRPLPKARPKEHVLGDALPPPHDRYVDGLLTGRVTCKATAVTPLFVSDSQAIDGKPKKHRSFRFFQYDGVPALPASSLRGMVRSVFETVTNSCFAVFDAERRLQYREQPRYGNQVKGNPGIVRRLADPDTEGEIELCQAAQAGAYYEGKDSWKNALVRKSNGDPWHTGNRVVARAERRGHRWLVREIAETRADLQALESGEEHLEGWLKISDRNEDTNKRNEALFLDPDIHGSEGRVSFSDQVQQDYNAVLKKQRELGDTPVKLASDQLREGDLVWVDMDDRTRRARRVVRVQIPRVPYQHTVGELLPSYLHPCTDYDELCPACRVFGWVRQMEKGEDVPLEVHTAYAGRVRFSHGVLQRENGRFNAILAILSSPKPTNTQFYLLKGGKPDGHVDYDSRGAQLRGRKFYRHHGDEPSKHAGGEYEYKRVNDVEDDQNRSVRDVLSEGAVFEIDLEFENLHPLELGGLLWSLTLEEEMHHRLGYGKPLGFGSVKVEIANLKVLNPAERYGTTPGDGWHDRTADKERWIAMFTQAMSDIYGDAFKGILKELHALLSDPMLEAIHYPRTTEIPTEEGENFKWFVGNTRKHGPHVPLALAPDDEGLPLMDERGRTQR